MQSKYGGPQSTEEYLRSAWAEQKHLEEEFECIVELQTHPTQQRGVYCFHFDADGPVVDVGLLVPIARYKATFPNGTTKDVGAFLFNGLIQLGKIVSEFRAREKAATEKH